MGRTVDERVVSMQFDNRNFEQNARTSMSTLDKLKQKLNLSGATKGLNEVNAASKKINFSEMENAAYKSGFHIQDIWLKTASVLEYQVAGKIVNAAKNMLNALTVAPVNDGWREYEMTLNAVQTTMAGTGKTIEEVEKELKKLDEYADKTVYSTADMLNNLPKFTNAGVDLEVATKAMIGIANATALAGGDAQKASIAYYNLGQAMSTGYLTRMDYNSINNAGIATMEWKKQMVEAAIAQGTLTKVGEDAYQAGGKTLTLQQLFIEGLQEQWATTEVMTKVFGDYGDETTDIGKKAYSAAQDIKTFTMMMDSLKATAGTGWKDTWQIIFGGLDEAKQFWTGLTNFISKIITGLADWRNKLLEGALKSPFGKIAEKMKELGDTAAKVTKPIQDFTEIVNRVINGEFGNTEERWAKLTELGYDWVKVQNLVNEQLGCTFRRQEAANEETEEAVEVTQELNDALLKEIGLTEEEIEVYKKLQEISKKTGIPIEEIDGRMLLMDSFRNIGKALVSVFTQLKEAWNDTFDPIRPVQILNIIDKFHDFTESLKLNHDQSFKLWRTFRGLFAVIDLIAKVTGGAFRIVFTVIREILKYFNLDILDVTAAIGDAIVRFNDWFDSVFNISGVLEVIIPIIAKVIGSVRNLISRVKESKAFQAFADRVRSVTNAIREWFAGLRDAENLPQYIANGIGTVIGYVLKAARDLLKNLIKFVTGGFKELPGHIASGFAGGLKDGIKNVAKGMLEFGRTIINKVKEILGIHSPSKVFFAIGGFVVAGFILGFRDKIGEVWPALGEFGNGVVNFVRNLDLGKVFAMAGAAALVAFTAAIAKGIGSLSRVFDGLGDILNEAADFVKTFRKTFKRLGKAISNSLNAMAIKNLAISIAILVGSIAVLTMLDPNKMWQAVGVIGAMVGVLAALYAITQLQLNFGKFSFGDKKGILETGKLAAFLFAIGSALMLAALAVKFIGSMDDAAFGKGIAGLIVLSGLMVGLIAATKLMVKSTFTGLNEVNGKSKDYTTNIGELGKTLKAIATAIIILAIAVKLIGSMDDTAFGKGIGGLIILAGLMVGLIAATKLMAKAASSKTMTGGGIDSLKESEQNIADLSKVLKAIATALLILVVSVKLLGSMDDDSFGKGIAGMLLLTGLMVGLIAATKLMAKATSTKVTQGGPKEMLKESSTNIESLAKTLLGIAASILLLIVAVKIIANMKTADLVKGTAGLILLGGLVVGLIAATKLAGGKKKLKDVGKTLMGVALAIGAMALVVALLAYLEPADIAKGAAAVSIFGGLIMGIVAVTKNAKNAKNTLIGVAIAIGVMTAALVVLSFIDPVKLIGPTVALGILMGMLAVILKSATCWTVSTGPLIALAIALAVMGAALAVLANMPIDGCITSAVSLSLLIIALSTAMKSLNKVFADKSMAKAILMMTLMIVPLLALVVVLSIASGIENATTNAIALSVLAYALAGAMKILGKVNANVKMVESILMLTLMFVPLMAFVVVLAAMRDVQNAITNALTLIVLAYAMTALLGPLSEVGKFKLSHLATGIGALTAMVLPLIAFVGVLTAMSGVQNALVNIIALTVLAYAMTALLGPLSEVGKVKLTDLAKGVGALTAMALPLIAFVGVLAAMSGVQNATANVLALVTLTAAMTLLLIPLALIGTFATNAIMGVLALAAMAAPMVVFVGVLALMQDIQNATENAELLIALMGAITDMLVKLSLVAPLALIAVPAVTALTGAIVAIGVLATAVGALMTACPQLEEFLNKGLPILERVAGSIGTMIGKFVAGFAGAVADILPSVGASLGLFMANAMPFIAGAKLVDESVSNGVKTLVGAILSLTAASIFEGIVSLLSLGSSFARLGTELSQFMINAMPFIEGARQIDPLIIESVKTLTDIIMTLTAAGVLEGLTSWFTGGSSIVKFGAEIAVFGGYLKQFADNVAGTNPESVKAAAEAGKALAEMASIIPNQGGIASWFAGDSSVAAFGAEIASFGAHLATFASHVANINPEAVRAAAEAGKCLADMANTIPNQGGIASWFAGDNSVAAFGHEIAAFGAHLAQFANYVANVNPEAVKAAAEAGKALAEMANTIPNQGGMASWFSGDNSMAAFGAEIASFGGHLAQFAASVANINPEAVKAAAEAGKALADMANVIPNQGGMVSWFSGDNSMAAFGQQIASFGGYLASFASSVAGVNPEAVRAAADAGKTLAQMANTAPDGSRLTTFGSNLKEFGKHFASFGRRIADISSQAVSSSISTIRTIVDTTNAIGDSAGSKLKKLGFSLTSFANSLHTFQTLASGINFVTLTDSLTGFDTLLTKLNTTGQTSVKFSTGAEKIVTAFATTVISKKGEMVKAVITMAESLASGIKARYNSFKLAGAYVVDGFAAGITANTWKAKAKAVAMAQAALQAAKDTLRINSPSKAFRDIGMSVPEGFAMGIDKLGGMVKNSAVDMADGAIDGTRLAIARIADAVNSDIETQPTIRPVLDLSDIESGASSISGMLRMTPSVGVLANVGAISSMMNNRQNGNNDDVVSALKDLKSSLSGRTGDTYTINGITYDDGSNVSEAIKTLVRAARIERRV